MKFPVVNFFRDLMLTSFHQSLLN